MKIPFIIPFILPLVNALVKTPAHPAHYHVPTVWLAGDSTMAPDGGHNGTQGWGEYLQYSFGTNVTGMRAFVNNSAYAGRSARSFTREGRFDDIAKALSPGDWVVIEFGINDGGSPYPVPNVTDKGRADCPGAGTQTCTVVYDNLTEVVLTYPAYLINASKMFLAKGGRVILSSPDPSNLWETGNYTFHTSIYSYYAMLAVTELGGPDAGVYFVQHQEYAAMVQKNLGSLIVDANYILDHTHTQPYLADLYSQAFVLGLKCGTSPLANLIVNATGRIEGNILGTCIHANSTIPI